MAILVTGSAGFIGYHVTRNLLLRGEHVIGVDNLNDYYDVRLKEARLQKLQAEKNFDFYRINIEDRNAVETLMNKHPNIDRIVHLAAQAGVRYSLTNPYPYVHSNIVGHLTLLESCRHLPGFKHLVFASSSSVYGANQKLPFSVLDPVDQPISLYAATKRSGELMSYTYSHLYGIKTTGLRYFTVYGPWGRPDMSAFIFTRAILKGEEFPIFNHGDMRRNFTFIDDVVQGTVGCLDHPPKDSNAPFRIYNIGNNRSEPLMDFIKVLENILSKKAKIRFEDMQPGDVRETIADISDTTRDFGFKPTTNIQEGLQQFVTWYRGFYGI